MIIKDQALSLIGIGMGKVALHVLRQCRIWGFLLLSARRCCSCSRYCSTGATIAIHHHQMFAPQSVLFAKYITCCFLQRLPQPCHHHHLLADLAPFNTLYYFDKAHLFGTGNSNLKTRMIKDIIFRESLQVDSSHKLSLLILLDTYFGLDPVTFC